LKVPFGATLHADPVFDIIWADVGVKAGPNRAFVMFGGGVACRPRIKGAVARWTLRARTGDRLEALRLCAFALATGSTVYYIIKK